MVSPGDDPDEADETEDRWQALTNNLLPPLLGLIGIGALACGVWASGQAERLPPGDVKRCATVVEDRARLGCYDRLSIPHHPPMGALTPPLTHAQGGIQSDKP